MSFEVMCLMNIFYLLEEVQTLSLNFSPCVKYVTFYTVISGNKKMDGQLNYESHNQWKKNEGIPGHCLYPSTW